MGRAFGEFLGYAGAADALAQLAGLATGACLACLGYGEHEARVGGLLVHLLAFAGLFRSLRRHT